MLAILVPPDQVADIVAARAITAPGDLLVDEGFERVGPGMFMVATMGRKASWQGLPI
jgi:hypothetical protein